MNDCSADHNKIIRRWEREADEKKEGNDERKKRVYGRTDCQWDCGTAEHTQARIQVRAREEPRARGKVEGGRER